MAINWLLFWSALAILITIAWASHSLAPWIPIRRKDLTRVLRLAQLKDNEVFIELGCGDGRLSRYVAYYTKARVRGIELAFPLYLWCVVSNFVTHTSRPSFRWANFFYVPLSSADVIYVFGMPSTLQEKFVQKIRHDVRPGTRLISYAFMIKGLTPDRTDKPSANDMTIYHYTIR